MLEINWKMEINNLLSLLKPFVLPEIKVKLNINIR